VATNTDHPFLQFLDVITAPYNDLARTRVALDRLIAAARLAAEVLADVDTGHPTAVSNRAYTALCDAIDYAKDTAYDRTAR
jgi:hypothetical protein